MNTLRMASHEYASPHTSMDTRAPSEKEIEQAVRKVISLFQSRKFYAVENATERTCVWEAAGASDLELLNCYLKFGMDYQAGCITAGVRALRSDSRSALDLEVKHLDAANLMISSVVEALRAHWEIDMRDSREKEYTEIVNHAVIHLDDTEIISKLVVERKMDNLEDIKIMLQRMKDGSVLPVSDGFL